MIEIRQKGGFKKLMVFLERSLDGVSRGILERYGREGVLALEQATPADTGETAQGWYYTVTQKKGTSVISFSNRNIQNGVPVAIVLQYGHATKNGGWVEGRDYINPALRPIFDNLAESAWREVTRR